MSKILEGTPDEIKAIDALFKEIGDDYYCDHLSVLVTLHAKYI